MHYEVTKELHFCAAHRLPGYEGACAFLHGHNYRVLITVSSTMLDREQMVVDFKDISLILGCWIQGNLDHGLLVGERDIKVRELFRERGDIAKLKVLPGSPTAETIADYILTNAKRLLKDNLPHPVKVESVTVYETPTSYARRGW